jgi:glycosyltransferase involved in cell wall biosynthesis
MTFSIVTVSYNQGAFLERTIESVLRQSYRDFEYIVVDAGSSDGSRAIIDRYRKYFSHVILEPDRGAADGLNKGFKRATGDIFGFLNSDDVLMPCALQEAADHLRAHPQIDVVSGACCIIDSQDRVLRRSYSDPFTLRRFAYGSSVLIQPSTFFRARAFRATSGFNVHNRSSWDSELFVDMLHIGAHFGRVMGIWSGYRIHAASITGSGTLADQSARDHGRMFLKIMQRSSHPLDRIPAFWYRLAKYADTPQALAERVLRGPVYGRYRSEP